MAELKIFIPDSLDMRFRKAAMNAHGYGRGSLSKAAAEALAEWCKEKESKQTLETNKANDPAPLENPSAPKPHPEILTGPENERAPVAGGT